MSLHSQSLTLCTQCSFKGWPQSCKHKARTCKGKELSEVGCTPHLTPHRAWDSATEAQAPWHRQELWLCSG